MNYRREIDGLRALAVIPVIFFHAGFDTFSGGFVGVDVFFVISGYLITTIILTEKESNTFTLLGFYERRARRILPALFFVIFSCMFMAWFCLFPDDMKLFSESIVSVTLFASNVFFWRDTNYFATAAELKPLLHTWSLAVEEQYYALFPIFILSTWRLGRRWIILLLTFAAFLSLAAAQWGSFNMPAATFFLLPTRCWELLIGVFVSFYLFRNCNARVTVVKTSQSISQTFSAIGLLLITYAVFTFNKKTPFPGLYALVPTIGTALIILFATQKTFVGNLLGRRLFVGIGLISYSAYLWHQPLFAFSRLHSIGEPSKLQLVALACAAFFLAYLTWKYVETPFRERNKITRKQVFLCCALFNTIFIGIGTLGHFSNGFEKIYQLRLSPEQYEIYSYISINNDEVVREGKCSLRDDQSYKNFSLECQNVNKNEPTLLIWGDSHAAALSKGLREVHKNVIQYTASACPPIVDVNILNRPNCMDINDFVKKEISRLKPNKIFLHANWYLYKDYDLKLKIDSTITSIRKISPETHITIIGSAPQYLPSLPKVMLMSGIDLSQVTFAQMSLYSELTLMDKELQQIAKDQDVEFLSPINSLCLESKCQIVTKYENKMMPTAFDYGHLTVGGSVLLANKLLLK